MNTTTINPILPAAGVSRNQAKEIREDSYPEINDGTLPNLSRRIGPDICRRPKAAKEALLRCKCNVILSPMNVQTLREHGRVEEHANCIKKQEIAVCGKQEHWRVHTTDMMEEIESEFSLENQRKCSNRRSRHQDEQLGTSDHHQSQSVHRSDHVGIL
jgi:hypothetical protein